MNENTNDNIFSTYAEEESPFDDSQIFWDEDEDWYTQPLTPEEKEVEARAAYEESIGELYASRYAFD